MTIHIHTGNLLEQKGILVHGCNAHGVMGAGIARAIKQQFPAAFQGYRDYYERNGLRLGEVIAVCHPELVKQYPALAAHINSTDARLPESLILVNAITQDGYGGRHRSGRDADYDAIEAAFVRVRMMARDSGLPVHFPLIGCGLAKGKWSDVAPRIEQGLGDIPGNLWLLPGATFE